MKSKKDRVQLYGMENQLIIHRLPREYEPVTKIEKISGFY